MKKKLLLLALMVIVLTCIFALSISAVEIDYNEKATLSDGTVLPIYDENQNPLIWFIKDDTATGMDRYASVPTNRNTADNATSYVTFNINSTYGENQLHDIYIKYWDAATSSYISYGEGTQVVCNYRGLTFYCVGTFANSGVLEYLYHPESCKDAGRLSGFSKLQLLDFSLSTNYTGFAEKAFNGCSALREVRFGTSESGYSLTCTNGNLFGSCTSLTTLKFADPSKIIGLQDGVFQNLTALKDISFVSELGITALPKNVFNGCSALTGTYEFANIKTIGEFAFRYAGTSEDSYLVLKFPNVTAIGGSTTDCFTFGNSGIREIYLGGSLSSMKLRTFDSSTKLIKVEMNGTSMTNMPMLTFYKCTALKAFSIPEGITSLDSYVFSGCTGLQAVYLPTTLTAINSGSQESSTFFNCKDMYFVDKAFTFTGDDDIPAKPDVYFFPSNLVTMTAETFKGCAGLNKTLVFPVGITAAANSWIFEAATSSVTLENIVFLGDMGNVSSSGGNGAYWDFKGKIYFCNPADKSLSDVNMGTFKDKAVFCFADGNTTHLANPLKTDVTDATCIANRFESQICFCNTPMGTVEIKETALGHNHDLENGASMLGIVYESFASEGYKLVKCERCDATDNSITVPAIYTYLGFAVKEDGTSLTLGYTFNKEAYENYIADNADNVVAFGFVAYATYEDESCTPLSVNNGVVSPLDTAKTIFASMSANYAAYDFVIRGFDETTQNFNIAMCAYTYNGKDVKYLCKNTEGVFGAYDVAYATTISKEA